MSTNHSCVYPLTQYSFPVQLAYHRFLPVSRAHITFSDPSFVQHALNLLNRCHLAGHRIQAFSIPTPPSPQEQRSRGDVGRIEAIQRGIIRGNGPSAGVKADGRDVVLWGLPGMLEPFALQGYLRRMKLVETGPDGRVDCHVARVASE